MIFKSRQSGCYDTAFYIRSYRRLVKRFMLIALMTMVLLLLCVYYALKDLITSILLRQGMGALFR